MLLKSISDEWFNAVCWSFCLSEAFIIKQSVEFSLIFLAQQNKIL